MSNVLHSFYCLFSLVFTCESLLNLLFNVHVFYIRFITLKAENRIFQDGLDKYEAWWPGLFKALSI